MQPDGTLDLGRRVRDLVHPLRERWHIVVLCAILTCAAALGFSLTQEERYASTAKLLIQEDGFDASVVGLDRGQQVDPERQTATDLALFRQYPLAERVVEETGADLSPKALLDSTSVEADGPSRVIEVTVTDDDPETAAALATTYARQYVRFRAANARQRYRRALGDIDGRLEALEDSDARPAAVRQLREQRDQVALLASLQSGDATVIEPARADDTPVSPDLVRNGILGLLVGTILGAMLASARERIDPRLREERQVTELLPGVPIIAAIPNSPVDYSGRPVEAEGFRGLQTTLSVLDADRAIRTVLVTSATVAEGKSTTSLSLALAMVERDESVLLMEGDLRRRTLSARLGLAEHEGLAEVLAGETTVHDQLVEVSLDPPTRARVGVGARTATAPLSGVVQVLPGGQASSNPHALLSPMRLQRALLEASALADKVVVDGTPLGLVKDMLPVATQADAVVVVARLHHTRRRELERLRDLLASARVQPFGLVLFGVEPDVAYDEYLGRR